LVTAEPHLHEIGNNMTGAHVMEFAYDRVDKLQRFGWDEVIVRGWTVVSMRDDWKVVFPSGTN
jgi:hypothetical protein